MKDNNKNVTEQESIKYNDLVYVANIGVVIIFILCVLVYFIVEKKLSVNSNICIYISKKSDLLLLLFTSFVCLPQFTNDILPKKYKFINDNKVSWRIHKSISFILCMLYLPIYLISLISCGKYI